MKKFVIAVIAFILVVSCCGCTPKTEYDDLEISAIETVWVEGMYAFRCDYVRTFDFDAGLVTDTRVADIDHLSEEDLPTEYRDLYNSPATVATFDKEQARAFYKKVKSLGILAWKDRYVTDEIICDGGNETVTIYFSDGTSKSTYIYFEYPTNYKKIGAAFETYLGAGLYFGQREL